MHPSVLIAEIKRFKKEKNAIILAHYYQEPAIQDVADFVGDSLGLASEAARTNADMIVFAGVHFMAETAKILNPEKKVVLPDLKAGCSLADACPPGAFRAFREQHPDHVAVTYINCSAEVKAASDIICTSSNARRIIESIPADRPILFAPDRNQGKYLMEVTGREMLLWDGACIVHEAFSLEKLTHLMDEYPEALLVAHPESETAVLEHADYVGSTTGMIAYIKKSERTTFIIATEAGILHRMKQEVPDKVLIPAPAHENNACACSECPYMRMNTLEKLYLCLRDESPEIDINESIRQQALKPLERMMNLSVPA